jgi:hypothetical protein
MAAAVLLTRVLEHQDKDFQAGQVVDLTLREITVTGVVQAVVQAAKVIAHQMLDTVRIKKSWAAPEQQQILLEQFYTLVVVVVVAHTTAAVIVMVELEVVAVVLCIMQVHIQIDLEQDIKAQAVGGR